MACKLVEGWALGGGETEQTFPSSFQRPLEAPRRGKRGRSTYQRDAFFLFPFLFLRCKEIVESVKDVE